MNSQSKQYQFGYFPRNKYKDLVFYLKIGEHSNLGLFEMPDTLENRAIMEALVAPTTISPAKKTWETCNRHFTCPNGEECWYLSEDFHNEEKAAIRNQTIDEFKKWNPFRQSFSDFIESLRTEAQK